MYVVKPKNCCNNQYTFDVHLNRLMCLEINIITDALFSSPPSILGAVIAG